MQTNFFKENIYNQLDIVKSGQVKMVGRMDMVSILKTYPSATFLCHQVNNEFNYMLLELMWCGFPVIHNAGAWLEFGYSYHSSNIEEGVEQLQRAKQHHHERIEVYKSHARTLAWKHSPYNPDVHRAWLQLLNIGQ